MTEVRPHASLEESPIPEVERLALPVEPPESRFDGRVDVRHLGAAPSGLASPQVQLALRAHAADRERRQSGQDRGRVVIRLTQNGFRGAVRFLLMDVTGLAHRALALDGACRRQCSDRSASDKGSRHSLISGQALEREQSLARRRRPLLCAGRRTQVAPSISPRQCRISRSGPHVPTSPTDRSRRSRASTSRSVPRPSVAAGTRYRLWIARTNLDPGET